MGKQHDLAWHRISKMNALIGKAPFYMSYGFEAMTGSSVDYKGVSVLELLETGANAKTYVLTK